MSDGTDLRVVRNDEAMRYEAFQGDELAGVLTFERTESGLDLQHTVVEEAFRGKGVGERLAVTALESARDRGERVIPSCPYLSRYISEHPEHADLVAT